MSLVNHLLWGLSLALEALLLSVLLRDRLWRTLPLFTALIGFYLLRAMLLFVIFAHVDQLAYALLYNLLAAVDLLFQIAVAWELWHAARPSGKTLWQSAARFAGLSVLSAVVAWGLSRWLPANPRSQLDRGVVMTGLLMVAVAVCSRWSSVQPAIRAVLIGLTTVGGVAVLAQVVRTLAAYYRSAPTFRISSYAEAVSYLLVLAGWTAVLWPRPLRRASKLSPQPS